MMFESIACCSAQGVTTSTGWGSQHVEAQAVHTVKNADVAMAQRLTDRPCCR